MRKFQVNERTEVQNHQCILYHTNMHELKLAIIIVTLLSDGVSSCSNMGYNYICITVGAKLG